jgi:protein deglycase
MQGGIPGAENLGGCAALESIVRRQAEKGGALRRHLRLAGDGVGAMGPAPRTQGLSACTGCGTAHPVVGCSAVCRPARAYRCVLNLMWCSALVQATAHPAFVEKFPAEVTAVDGNVVVDGKVVTGRGPATAMEFALTLVEQLYGKDKVEQIAKPMVRDRLSLLSVAT